MSDENVVDFPAPDADPDIPGARWDSAEERDAFIAEHTRRTEAGESLEGLGLPITVENGDEE